MKAFVFFIMVALLLFGFWTLTSLTSSHSDLSVALEYTRTHLPQPWTDEQMIALDPQNQANWIQLEPKRWVYAFSDHSWKLFWDSEKQTWIFEDPVYDPNVCYPGTPYASYPSCLDPPYSGYPYGYAGYAGYTGYTGYPYSTYPSYGSYPYSYPYRYGYRYPGIAGGYRPFYGRGYVR